MKNALTSSAWSSSIRLGKEGRKRKELDRIEEEREKGRRKRFAEISRRFLTYFEKRENDLLVPHFSASQRKKSHIREKVKEKKRKEKDNRLSCSKEGGFPMAGELLGR